MGPRRGFTSRSRRPPTSSTVRLCSWPTCLPFQLLSRSASSPSYLIHGPIHGRPVCPSNSLPARRPRPPTSSTVRLCSWPTCLPFQLLSRSASSPRLVFALFSDSASLPTPPFIRLSATASSTASPTFFGVNPFNLFSEASSSSAVPEPWMQTNAYVFVSEIVVCVKPFLYRLRRHTHTLPHPLPVPH